MLYDNGLTKYNTTIWFQWNNLITREQTAKFFSQFAIKVMWKKPDTKKVAKFSDLKYADTTLQPQIQLAYQLGIFWWYPDGTFQNQKNMNKWEAIAVLMRIYLGKKLSETGSPWYKNYFNKAEELWVIWSWDMLNNFNENISRKELALFIYRTSLLNK
jgi:hypothetical protein